MESCKNYKWLKIKRLNMNIYMDAMEYIMFELYIHIDYFT